MTNKNLRHIPLLEGEEAIKELSLKSNKISKIENLVSLPHLVKIDLSNNVIVDLQGLKANALSLNSLRINAMFSSVENFSISSNLK